MDMNSVQCALLTFRCGVRTISLLNCLAFGFSSQSEGFARNKNVRLSHRIQWKFHLPIETTLSVRVIWIKDTEICASIKRSLSKENHKRQTKNGEKKLAMKVMWPPNNKVNESITKVTVTKKTASANVENESYTMPTYFQTKKRISGYRFICVAVSYSLAIQFFRCAWFFSASATCSFFSFRTYECNSGSLWICYDAVFFFLIPTFLPFAHLSVGTCAASHRFLIRWIPI